MHSLHPSIKILQSVPEEKLIPCLTDLRAHCLRRHKSVHRIALFFQTGASFVNRGAFLHFEGADLESGESVPCTEQRDFLGEASLDPQMKRHQTRSKRLLFYFQQWQSKYLHATFAGTIVVTVTDHSADAEPNTKDDSQHDATQGETQGNGKRRSESEALVKGNSKQENWHVVPPKLSGYLEANCFKDGTRWAGSCRPVSAA